jgi:hypothetical protein
MEEKSNTWLMRSMDISGVGKAPDVEFTFSDDNRVITAEPPGGHIRIEAGGGDTEGFRSRIVLTSMLTGSVYADIEARHSSLPDLPKEWEDPAQYAGELACSLYWSMWRMQQLKAAAQPSAPEAEGKG